MANILILFAHPALEKSRVQIQLLQAAKHIPGVTVQDLYEVYPDFNVNVKREQALLLRHDIILFQHPLYWYSAPALMKQWQDLVLEHGWAYGHTGRSLAGKSMSSVISTGGATDTYQPGAKHGHTLASFLLPYVQTAALCNMRYLSPYIVQGTHRMDASAIRAQAGAYRQWLEQLRDAPLTQ